ncbi:cysteine desulfurase family protein [Caldalkalibacillus salinus]|uniref:cysteine desulfurase family protein n=1 Tax=Caldalkalibacillus salinus TaxID=2803787 RepID=UPI001923F98E|nr:cysteine desulfurase family protein [Caldalkalibacillus salinus]
MADGRTVYFDNSATTQPSKEVVQSMVGAMEQFYGNPSSLHHLGVQAEQLVSKSKEVCAQLLGVNSHEIIFTSGGTESNNLAVKGVALGYQDRGRHIITSAIEHSSIHEICEYLKEHHQFDVTYLPVDTNGLVSPDDVNRAIRPDTVLVSVMHVNNEIGSIQPIHDIGRIIKDYPKIYFHVDQVQGVGKAPLTLKESHIDLLSLSGHKIHAPKGTGLLYVNERIQNLIPLFHGGAQQRSIRPGTENVPGIVAMAKALRLTKEQEQAHIQHLKQLRTQILEGLSELEGVKVNSPIDETIAAPHIVNVSFLGLKPEVLVHAFEEKGLYVSTKSACSSKDDKPSRILTAAQVDDNAARSAVRISFSHHNTTDEVQYFIDVVKDLLPYYKKIMKV